MFKNPGKQLFCLIGVELFYIAKTVQKYKMKRHLRSLRMLIPKLVQSVFVLTFELTIAVLYLSSDNRDKPLKIGT